MPLGVDRKPTTERVQMFTAVLSPCARSVHPVSSVRSCDAKGLIVCRPSPVSSLTAVSSIQDQRRGFLLAVYRRIHSIPYMSAGIGPRD